MNGASDAEKDLYSTGFCHVHAIAAHRLHGGAFLVILDHGEPYWCGEDPDDVMPAVVHVFSVHDAPGGVIARDVLGDRPVADALAEAVERFNLRPELAEASRDSLEELLDYVDQEEDCDRPLCGFTETDVEEAMAVATAAAALPGRGDAPAPIDEEQDLVPSP